MFQTPSLFSLALRLLLCLGLHNHFHSVFPSIGYPFMKWKMMISGFYLWFTGETSKVGKSQTDCSSLLFSALLQQNATEGMKSDNTGAPGHAVLIIIKHERSTSIMSRFPVFKIISCMLPAQERETWLSSSPQKRSVKRELEKIGRCKSKLHCIRASKQRLIISV